MQNKQSKKTSKIKFIIILATIIAIIIVASLIIINNNKNEFSGNVKIFNGVYKYNEDVSYQFKGNGKGILFDKQDKYKFKYDLNDTELFIKFEDETIEDSTYEYTLENDTLTIIGKEGTVGGTYILKKQ